LFFLKDPSKYMALGGQLPKGILLVGPPGTGKTLMARATAGEANVPFFSISGSEFIEMFVGVGTSRVRDMFKQAKKEAPSIIFVDELDSIGRVRGTGLGGGHDEREQTLNQILAEMDGFLPHESVVVMAATNRPDVLDPALIRPGRFDRRVTLELPQKNTRKEILEVHTRNVPLSDDVDLESLASRTAGFSGADIKNLVNEAALLAARKEKKRAGPEGFDQGRDKILMGIEREDVIKDEDKKIIAYHEAGHALMARLLPSADPLEKVSIIPRGRSLRSTEQIPEEDWGNLSRKYLLDRIAIMLGGRASERLFSQDFSTGAGDDLKQVTELARRMVCQWGMSEKLGPITFRQGENHPFLGREIGQQRDFSEESARIIDEEIRRIIRDMEKKADDMLKSNRDTLDGIAKQLLVKETLSNDDIDTLLTQDHDSSRE
jgi:cell division protease FtsH